MTNEYYLANKERILEHQRQYYLKNREKVIARTKEYGKKNKEKRRVATRAWAKRNPEKIFAAGLKSEYGITIDQYKSLLASLNGRCHVCSILLDSKTKGTRPHVDHCHSTGVVRGMLCHKCNVAEDFLSTSDNALRLYEYMLRNEMSRQSVN